jgi:hypothetical protein
LNERIKHCSKARNKGNSKEVKEQKGNKRKEKKDKIKEGNNEGKI